MPLSARSPSLLQEVIDVELLAFTAGCHCVPFELGRVVTHPAFYILYDANLSILERLPPTLQPHALEVNALEQQTRALMALPSQTHLRFMVVEPRLQELLGPLFLAAGYRHNRYRVMVHHNPPQREPNPEIKLSPVLKMVDHVRLDQIENEAMKEVRYNSPLIRAILRSRRRELCQLLPLQLYWSELLGVPAGSVGLLHQGRVASIQSVSTRPHMRRRGVATTMVLRLLELAQQAGAMTVSLLTDADDFPQRLYEHLGFVSVALIDSYIKDEA
ncbi:MAG: GNAT family N-acetyltransferase [Myxococcota bacterium]